MIFASALFIGHNIVRLETVNSTNDYALKLLTDENPTDGTVVTAVQQTQGRGQYGSTWASQAAHNLTLSIILRPKQLPIQRQFALSMVTALAVRSLCQSYHVEAKIKWPNDIYIKRKKTAGILIQNGIMKQQISSSVIGIGLNVNQTDFDPSLPNPTSLSLETGQTYDLEVIQKELLEHFERFYLDLLAASYEVLREQYLVALFQKDVVRSYQRQDGGIFNGIIRSVTIQGKLCMEVDDQIEEIDLKDIKYII